MEAVGVLLIVAFVGGIIALVVLAIVLSIRHERKRREALAAVAASMNFTYAKDDDGTVMPSFGMLHLFQHGRSKRAYNVMRGSAMGIDVSIFDYRYTTGGGKNQTTHQQTVVGFVSEKLYVPQFALCPENFFHRIGSVFGYQDIDFPDYPEFSKAYLLRGSDEEGVRMMFRDDVLRYFEQKKGLRVEGVADRLIYHRSGRRLKPEEIRPLMEEAFGVFSLLKKQS